MKKKAMLSQPMAGRTEQEIVDVRDRAIAELERRGYEVANNMSLCHAAYFCHGWQNERGCRIEHDAAVAYGLEVIEE